MTPPTSAVRLPSEADASLTQMVALALMMALLVGLTSFAPLFKDASARQDLKAFLVV